MQEKPQSTLMETKSSHNGQKRITLWRNTIQLFYEDKRNSFVGPFKKGEFKLTFIEPFFLNKESEVIQNPDIFACNLELKKWLILELTFNDKSKSYNLDSYKQLEPRDLSSIYNLPHFRCEPDIISSRLKHVNDGNHCVITVLNEFDVKNENFIEDTTLRKSLTDFKGTNLDRLPSIPITLVPEMKRQEIPEGLITIVLQLFAPNSVGLSASEICELGMERIYNITMPQSKQTLISHIKEKMNDLIKGELKGYLELKDGKYHVTDKFKNHPQSRNKIASKLQNWAYPERTTLSNFEDKLGLYDD